MPRIRPGERGDRHRQRHAGQPRPVRAEEPVRADLVPRAVRAGQQRDGVGADGVEADVAEVEQAGLADHDVEADRDERDHGELRHRAAEADARVCPGTAGCSSGSRATAPNSSTPKHPLLHAGTGRPTSCRRPSPGARAVWRPRRCAIRSASRSSSCPRLPEALAEYAGRPEQQHQNQQHERDDVAPLGAEQACP